MGLVELVAMSICMATAMLPQQGLTRDGNMQPPISEPALCELQTSCRLIHPFSLLALQPCPNRAKQSSDDRSVVGSRPKRVGQEMIHHGAVGRQPQTACNPKPRYLANGYEDIIAVSVALLMRYCLLYVPEVGILFQTRGVLLSLFSLQQMPEGHQSLLPNSYDLPVIRNKVHPPVLNPESNVRIGDIIIPIEYQSHERWENREADIVVIYHPSPLIWPPPPLGHLNAL
ncbi:hypothetical protein F5X96DRAFT_333933 [Biscogniauxia mediterranea]|nr:hypothetical protein F5X96DRAFT_333933 [Biscogniauxia mediterranea]